PEQPLCLSDALRLSVRALHLRERTNRSNHLPTPLGRGDPRQPQAPRGDGLACLRARAYWPTRLLIPWLGNGGTAAVATPGDRLEVPWFAVVRSRTRAGSRRQAVLVAGSRLAGREAVLPCDCGGRHHPGGDRRSLGRRRPDRSFALSGNRATAEHRATLEVVFPADAVVQI